MHLIASINLKARFLALMGKTHPQWSLIAKEMVAHCQRMGTPLFRSSLCPEPMFCVQQMKIKLFFISIHITLQKLFASGWKSRQSRAQIWKGKSMEVAVSIRTLKQCHEINQKTRNMCSQANSAGEKCLAYLPTPCIWRSPEQRTASSCQDAL